MAEEVIIDRISIEVDSNAADAVGPLNQLSDALKGLRDSVKGLSSIKTVTNDVSGLQNSLSKIRISSTGIVEPIKNLGKGIQDISVFARESFSPLRNLAENLLKLYIIKRVAKSIGEFVLSSAQAISNLKMFRISMGEAAIETERWVKHYSEALNLDPNPIYRAAGFFNQLASGLGVAADKSAIISKNMVQLGYDMAAFLDIPVSEAMNKLESGLAGVAKPLRQVGIAVSEAALQQELLNMGYNISYRSLSEQSRLQLRYITIMKNSANMQGYFAQNILLPANAFSLLRDNAAVAGRSIGNIFIPMLSAIVPYAIAAMQVISELANAIARLFGFDIQKYVGNVGGGIGDVTEDMEDLEDAVGGVGKAVKNVLAPFDELHDISQAVTGSMKSAAGVDIDFPTELYQYDALAGKIADQIDEIKNKIKIFLDDLTEAFTGVDLDWFRNLGQNISNYILDGLNLFDWDAIRIWASNLGDAFASLLNGIFDNPDLWRKIGETIAQWMNTKLEFQYAFAITLDWEQVGKDIALALNMFFDTYDWALHGATFSAWAIGLTTAISTALRLTRWETLGQGIIIAIRNVNWLTLLKGVFDVIIEALGAIWRLALGLFVDNIRLGELRKIADALDVLRNALYRLGEIVLDGLAWAWENIFQPFGQWALTTVLPIVFELIAIALNSIADVIVAVGRGFEYLWKNGLKQIAGFVGKAFIEFLNVLKVILPVITPALGGIAIGLGLIWAKNKVLTLLRPLATAFSNIGKSVADLVSKNSMSIVANGLEDINKSMLRANIVGSIGIMITSFVLFSDIAPGLKIAFGVVATALFGIATAMGAVEKSLGIVGILVGVATTIVGIFDSISSSASDIGIIVPSVFGDVQISIETFKNGLGSYVPEITQSFIEITTKLDDEQKSWGIKFDDARNDFKKFADGAIEGKNIITEEALPDILTEVESTFDTWRTKLEAEKDYQLEFWRQTYLANDGVIDAGEQAILDTIENNYTGSGGKHEKVNSLEKTITEIYKNHVDEQGRLTEEGVRKLGEALDEMQRLADKKKAEARQIAIEDQNLLLKDMAEGREKVEKATMLNYIVAVKENETAALNAARGVWAERRVQAKNALDDVLNDETSNIDDRARARETFFFNMKVAEDAHARDVKGILASSAEDREKITGVLISQLDRQTTPYKNQIKAIKDSVEEYSKVNYWLDKITSGLNEEEKQLLLTYTGTKNLDDAKKELEKRNKTLQVEIKGSTQKIYDLEKAMYDAVEDIWEINSAISDSADEAYKLGEAWGVELPTGVGIGIKSTQGLAVGSMQEMLGEIDKSATKYLDMIGGTSRLAKTWGEGTAKGYGIGLKDNAWAVLDEWGDILEEIVVAPPDILGMRSPSKVTEEYGKWTVEGLAIGMQSRHELVKQTISTLIDAIKNKVIQGFEISGTESVFMRRIGQYLSDGLWNGIVSRQSTLLANIGNWCRSIINRINQEFQISSPSKVTYDTGVFVGEGLVDGIESMLDDISEVSQRAVDSFNGPWASYEGINYNALIDYQALIDDAVRAGNLMLAAQFELQRNAKIMGENLQGIWEMTFNFQEPLNDAATDIIQNKDKPLSEIEKVTNDISDILIGTMDEIKIEIVDMSAIYITLFEKLYRDILVRTQSFANSMVSTIRTMVSQILSMLSEIPGGASFSGGVSFSVPIQGFADGGLVPHSAGQLFMANENGVAELIGRHGNQTAVVNQDQIVDIFASALIPVLNDALAPLQGGGQGDIYMDGEKVGEVVKPHIDAIGARQGQHLSRNSAFVGVY
jgi:hypothetical protein